jgi:two-component system CheB/CheR fusion protein
MKKHGKPNRTKKRRDAKPKREFRKTSASQALSQTRRTGREVLHLAEDAEVLKNRSDHLRRKASDLHQSIDEVHFKAKLLHGQVGGEQDSQSPLRIDLEPKGAPRGKPFPIVGVGASAGGFEAFVDFLRELPKDTGMAYVLVQHLDPKHRSQVSDLLSHKTSLPVIDVRKDMEVRPNHVYVMPENAVMTISEGRLRLAARKDSDIPPMPIDAFFRSLAAEQQHRAVAVVLSGTGSDGTLGVEAIKGEGGITFAQDERSAKHFGMPASAIAGGSIDFVLSPTQTAAELARIARHPFLGRPSDASEAPSAPDTHDLQQTLSESSKELHTLFGILRARTGVDFSFYKSSTLNRRIIRRMILHKHENLSRYLRMLERDTAEVDALFKDLLINVTSFFRDPQAFQLLKTKVLPKLIKAHPEQPLRMWVCGCATGEEAYSLAMTVTEFFDQTRLHRPFQIFATDISEAGIERARAGIYPENILQDISADRLRRFFSKANGSYQVNKSIRDLCVFARQNVLVDPPFSNLDLICCRNVLIYFGPTLQRKIIPIFHYALRPSGFLLLGNSETVGPATDLFGLVNKKYKLYLKKPSYLRPTFDLAERGAGRENVDVSGSSDEKAAARQAAPLNLQQEVDKILLRDFSPGAVVVSQQLEVVQFRGRTGDYLEHSPGAPSLNLFKLARESIVMDLRTALTRAIKQDAPVKQSGVHLRLDGRTREITIEVVPFKLAASNERYFVVAFKELEPGSTLDLRDIKESAGVRQTRERREASKLRSDLIATKESMQSIIEEQEATNEELKSANEEIQSSNEELQSTNEELETAKEELQSTNEELTTLNEELQNRNTELGQVNNDLTNLLSSVNIAVLMLTNELTIRRFTPMAERIFNLIPSDVGRRLGEMNRSILVPDLEGTVRSVMDSLSPIEREAQDRDGHWYLLRIRPYRTRENRIDGAVIILVEIDEVNRALEGIMATVPQPLLALGPDFRVRHMNDAFRKLFGISQQTGQGTLVYDLGGGEWNLPQFRALLEDVLQQNQQVTNLEIEGTFARPGFRKLRVSARRFYEAGRGIQMILVAFEDITGNTRGG